MASVTTNITVPWGSTVLINISNLTSAGFPGVTSSPEPPCTMCCCGLLNRTLTVAFMIGLAFAIVIGNVVTLTVFMQTRQSHTPQGYLKVSLAIADMIVGVVVVPFSVYTEISIMVTSTLPKWYQSGSMDSARELSSAWQPCLVIGPMFTGCTFISISTIFLMTVERSVAILWPLQKDTFVTRRRTLLLILISWTGSFLLAVAPLILSDSLTFEYNECSRMCIYVPLLMGLQLPADTNIMLLFPAFDFTLLGSTLIVNILSFTSICRYTRKRKLLLEGLEGSTSISSHRPSFTDIKAAKTIAILTLSFAASFLPIAVFVLGNVVGYTWCNFSFFAFWILTGNSCCNVIIYSIRDHRFRKGVSLLFHRERSQAHSEKS
ncbi:trace amine-associated receptor 8a-like [Clarias gariepinus]